MRNPAKIFLKQDNLADSKILCDTLSAYSSHELVKEEITGYEVTQIEEETCRTHAMRKTENITLNFSAEVIL